MRRTLLGLSGIVLMGVVPVVACAHHPHRETQPVHPRVDVIPPLGNNLPESYRRRYNRPQYWSGKIAYWIAPSSQEAMAWHRAEHAGLYDRGAGPTQTHYFYPKPWEVLPTGSRRATAAGTTKETVVAPQSSPSTKSRPARLPPVTAAKAGTN